MRFLTTGLLLSCFAVGWVISENVKILTPDDRSISIKLEPSTTLLKVLEDVCKRLNLDPNEYELRLRDRVLNLSSSFRLSGLRNNVEIQLVKAKKRRDEVEVEIVIQLDTGTRLDSHKFKPNTTLLEIVQQLCPDELSANDLTFVFMRTEVGSDKLGETTLKDIGLMGGRAIVKLKHGLEKTELKGTVALKKPAPVPRPARKPRKLVEEEEEELERKKRQKIIEEAKKIREKAKKMDEEERKLEEKKNQARVDKFKSKPGKKVGTKWLQNALNGVEEDSDDSDSSENAEKKLDSPESSSAEENKEEDKDEKIYRPLPNKNKDTNVEKPKEDVEKKRREKPLNTVGTNVMRQALQDEQRKRAASQQGPKNEPAKEEPVKEEPAKKKHEDDDAIAEKEPEVEGEIHILGERNAMLFKNDDARTVEVDVDFDLKASEIEELRKELQEKAEGNTNKPLLTAELREKAANEEREAKMNRFKTVIVRVQFTNRYVLQGTFMANETIGMVKEFVRQFLADSSLDFFLFTTPPKKVFSEDELSLFDAKCIPSVRFRFGCNEARSNYLKEDILEKTTSPSQLKRSNAALKKSKASERVESRQETVKPRENSDNKSNEKSLNLSDEPIDFEKMRQQALQEARKKREQTKEKKPQNLNDEPIDFEKMRQKALDKERKRREQNKQSGEPVQKKQEEKGEIHILGDRNAVLYKNDDTRTVEVDVDFDLKASEAEELRKELQEKAKGNPNKPLLTAELREKAAKEEREAKMKRYNKIIVRVQLPNRYVLQGIFKPDETIGMVKEFVRQFLADSSLDFFLFTSPPKKVLSEELSLFDAKCIPSARLHFGCNEARSNYLKEDILEKTTSPSLLHRVGKETSKPVEQ